MSVLTLSELATIKGVSTSDLPAGAQGWLDRAEDLVAGMLGTTTLAQETGRTTQWTPKSSTRWLPTQVGPVVTLQAITVDDDDASSNVYRTYPWVVEMSEGENVSGDVVMTLTTGWASGALPQQRPAALVAAYDVSALDSTMPAGLASLSIGDWSASRMGGTRSGDVAQRMGDLLRKWRPVL